MRSFPGLGAANLALASLYFAPVWGRDAVQALLSPYSGFRDRAHTAMAVYLRRMFDLDLDGLILTCNLFAGLKLLIAAGFLAFAIEFARSLVKGRDVDRHTVDVVLALAAAGVAIWTLPALALDDSNLVRIHATQLLLVVGAVIVIVVERHLETPRILPAETAAPVRAAKLHVVAVTTRSPRAAISAAARPPDGRAASARRAATA